MEHYYFGVEIEVIAQPHVIDGGLDYKQKCDLYYGKLANTMRSMGLNAQAEGRSERYKSQCDTRRWTVMRDTSLEEPELERDLSEYPRQCTSGDASEQLADHFKLSKLRLKQCRPSSTRGKTGRRQSTCSGELTMPFSPCPRSP